MADGVTVTLLFLVQSFLVRIQVGQQTERIIRKSYPFFIPGKIFLKTTGLVSRILFLHYHLSALCITALV